MKPGYEFKIVEWVLPAGPLTIDLTAVLNEHGQDGWELAHIHEAMRGERVLFLVFLQRLLYPDAALE